MFHGFDIVDWYTCGGWYMHPLAFLALIGVVIAVRHSVRLLRAQRVVVDSRGACRVTHDRSFAERRVRTTLPDPMVDRRGA